MLRKMCLEHKRSPPSYAITDGLRWIGDCAHGGGGSTDVWRGAYRGSKVAIKVLRINSKNLARLEKVRPFVYSLLSKNAVCADESGTEIISRSGPEEAIQTPEPVAVGGNEKFPISPGDGFRVDGTWYYHKPHRCAS